MSDTLDLKILKDLPPTKGQSSALAMVAWLIGAALGRPAIGVICGYAGTGKTTLLRMIAAMFGALQIICPTGRASARVTEATGLQASTIHRYLFKPKENPTTLEIDWVLKPIDEIPRPASGLLVVEEGSMVSLDLWEKIHEVAVVKNMNVLIVGDDWQLSPVVKDKNADQFSLVSDDFRADRRVKLTEIQRQAADSPIIRATMDIRNNKALEGLMSLPSVPVDRFVEAVVETIRADGKIICRTNELRHYINRLARKELGYGSDLCIGEPLSITRNSYDLDIYNGELTTFNGWSYLSSSETKIYDSVNKDFHYTKFGRAIIEGKEVVMSLSEVMGATGKCPLSFISKTAKRTLGKNILYLHASLGYAHTCHRFQGSEAPKILVIFEHGFNLDHLESRRWAYTALTRSTKDISYIWGFKIPT